MKKIIKWLGIAVAIVALLFVLIIVFVPSSNKSFNEGREAGQTEVTKLSEKQKKSIYKEAVAAEDKGTAEAEEQCPTNASEEPLFSQWQEMTHEERMKYMENCFDLQNQLLEKYRNEVLAKYGLSEEQWFKIAGQALDEDWPTE